MQKRRWSGKDTLSNKAYKQIEERIVTLKLPPGEVLSEIALSEQLKIGRTPIREALQLLSHEGLVQILPRRGVLVSEINVNRQIELLTVRREIERLMAKLSAERASPSERDEFAELARNMDQHAESEDSVAFMRSDQELDSLIATTCRNEFAQRAIRLMNGLSRRFWYAHHEDTLDLPRCAKLHAALARAISRGNSDRAATASDRLLDYIENFTRLTV